MNTYKRITIRFQAKKNLIYVENRDQYHSRLKSKTYPDHLSFQTWSEWYQTDLHQQCVCVCTFGQATGGLNIRETQLRGSES